jgi:hypothetical protein
VNVEIVSLLVAVDPQSVAPVAKHAAVAASAALVTARGRGPRRLSRALGWGICKLLPRLCS